MAESNASDEKKFRAIMSKSKLTEADARKLADKVNEGMLSRLRKQFPMAFKENERTALLEELDKLCKNSKLTDEDCLRLGRAGSKNISKRS